MKKKYFRFIFFRLRMLYIDKKSFNYRKIKYDINCYFNNNIIF